MTKHYNMTCATSEYSAKPAHPRSLTRVFADHRCLLQPPGYPKGNKREPPPYWVDVQADMSLCSSHRSYCRFCRALAQSSLLQLVIALCGSRKTSIVYIDMIGKPPLQLISTLQSTCNFSF